MESNLLGFEIKDGVLLGYRGEERDIVIPREVQEIGDQAFFCCPDLAEVAIGGDQ